MKLHDLKVSDFDFDLPSELIAQHPLQSRSACRLMHIDREKITEDTDKTQENCISHHHFYDLPKFLKKGDLLILNNSFVIAARIFTQKKTGGSVEILVERILEECVFLAQLGGSRVPKEGEYLFLKDNNENTIKISFEIIERSDRFFLIRSNISILDICDKFGHIPLPPYIERGDEDKDRYEYQNVFANPDKKGSVAAPTAGLHFDNELINKLKLQGVKVAYLTLHVGAGTFLPVKSENIYEHKMHSEWFHLSQETADLINQTKLNHGKVIAVGTTVTRALEHVSQVYEGSEKISEYSGNTDIFIYPGVRFRLIDGLITNFHLPKSTLIMLVSAFAGENATHLAYIEAVEQKYRFFSYGDAMIII